MNICIYCNDFKKGSKQLDKIIKNINDNEIVLIKKSNRYQNYEVRLKNKDCYKVLIPNANVRGYKWQYAYIDKDIIDKVFINEMILRAFVSPNRLIGKINLVENIEDYITWY